MCLSKKTIFFFSLFSIFLFIQCAHINWKKTCEQNQIDSYEKFLEKYPDSKYAEEAKKRLDKLAFQKAKKKNTLSAYLTFLHNYLDSKHIKEITKTIDSILKEIKTVKLDVKGEFPRGYEFSGISWHIPERMSEIFEYFGLALLDSAAKSADIVFQIQLKGTSLSGSYSGGISGSHNSGAKVSGTGIFLRNGEIFGEFEFKGEEQPSSTIYWSYDNASDAPFFSAFATSDLYAKTFSLLNKIYRLPPEKLWQVNTEPDPKMTYNSKHHTLYVGSSNHKVYAIDAENGKIKWVKKTTKDVIQPPVVKDSLILVCTGSMGSGKIYALKADNGKMKWWSDIKEARLLPKVYGNIVYVRSRGFSSFDGDFLYALDISNGNLQWSDKISITPKEFFMFKDNVLFVNGGGKIYAINTLNGTVLWDFSGFGDVSAPIIFEDILYLGDSSQHIYAVNSRDRRVLWKFDIPGEYISTFIPANPIKFNSLIYVKSQHNILYALDAKTGNIQWQYNVEGDFEEPIMWNQLLFISSKDSSIYAFNALDGVLKWKFHKKGIYNTAPVIEQGILYVDSQDNYVYALNALDGKRLWKFQTNNDISAICAHQDVVYAASDDGVIYALKSGME